MKGILVDSNAILDIFLNDPDWAEAILGEYCVTSTLTINPTVKLINP